MRANQDFDILVEGSEECHQPFDGIFAEMAFTQARNFGLADAHQGAGLGLGQVSFGRKAIEFGDDLCFEEMCRGVWKAEIGEDVRAGIVKLGLLDGHGAQSLSLVEL